MESRKHIQHNFPCRSVLPKTFLLLLLSFMTAGPVTAQDQLLGSDLLRDNDKLVIPFDLVQGFMIVNITFNLVPLKFIVDTGASNTLLFDRYYADLFAYPYSDTLQVVGSNIDSSIVGYVVRGGKFWIHDRHQTRYVNRDFITLSEDHIDLQQAIGYQVDGILGGDFFKRLTLQINYKKRKLTLHRPESYKPSKGYSEHSLEIINGKPYTDVTIVTAQTPIPLRLLVDTGAAITLLVNTNADTLINVPADAIPAYLGKGLSGNIRGHMGLLESLQTPPYEFTHLPINFQTIKNADKLPLHRNGLLGSLLLSKFHVVLDYAHGLMYLKPNRDFKKSVKLDKSGLVLNAIGPDLNQFLVHYVYPHSPAAEAGLRKGDQLLKIGRRRTTRYNLDQMLKKFRGKTDKKIILTFLRNNTELTTTITLRPLLDNSPEAINKVRRVNHLQTKVAPSTNR